MSSRKSVLLKGLQPQPLSGYLAALGVLRICASAQSGVLGAFARDGFTLEGIDQDELLSLLLDTWVPPPVLSPWNNASGFYDSSKGRMAAAAMKTLLASDAPRFATLNHLIFT